VSTDEREEQTRKILKAHAKSRKSAVSDIEAIVARHHAIQRMIASAPADVVIPYAERMADLFPASRPESRRAFPQTLSMIEAVALLFHLQRETDQDGRIVATRKDYEIARQLLEGPMGRAVGGDFSEGAKRFVARLMKWGRHINFTSTDASAKEKFSSRHVRGWLIELTEAGVLKIVEEGKRGKSYVYCFAHATFPGGDDAYLKAIVEGRKVLPMASEFFDPVQAM
jgi:hypothetical protein